MRPIIDCIFAKIVLGIIVKLNFSNILKIFSIYCPKSLSQQGKEYTDYQENRNEYLGTIINLFPNSRIFKISTKT
jgi:hypothetical protein